MRRAFAILVVVALALAPLHAATAALCVDGAPEPAEQRDSCCPAGSGDRPGAPEQPAPTDDPCEGCDCALACCGVQARTLARTGAPPPVAMSSGAVEAVEQADDLPPPDRRPDGVRRPPKAEPLR